MIYRRCLKILRNPDDAKDACQKVFLQIVRHRAQLPWDEVEQLRWAYVIATRVCLTARRDAWEIADEKPLDDGGPPSGGGVQELVDRQLAQRALSHAGENERMVAWLVFVDGHTQEEAAELLGLSRKTIGKRLHLFLAGARRILTGG